MTINWSAIAIGTQFANALAWLLVCLHFTPSVFRILTDRGRKWDAAGAWSFVVGCVMDGYMLRWVAAGPSIVAQMPLLPWWVVCNIASIAAAVGALMHFEVADVEAANKRSRAALMMWGAVVASCCLAAAALA